jgi:hypothetical protein
VRRNTFTNARKEMRVLIRAAKKAEGWDVQPTRNNHIVFTTPSGQRIYAASTSSDGRSWKSTRCWLRRAGLDV